MSKSHVPAIKSCACISSAELVRRFHMEICEVHSQIPPLVSQIYDTTRATCKKRMSMMNKICK